MRGHALLALALVAGCRPGGGVVVGVADDRGEHTTTLHILVNPGQAGSQPADQAVEWGGAPDGGVTLDGGVVLPGTLVLYSDSYLGKHAELIISDDRGTRRALEFLVEPGETRFVRAVLGHACGNIICAGGSCADGLCTDETMDVHTFPDYHDGMEAVMQCALDPPLIGSVDSMPLPMVGGCGDGQYCREGTCYDGPAPRSFGFAAPVSTAAGTKPAALAGGNFDGDEGRDLAIADANDGGVTVLLGRGDGTFATAARVTVGAVPLGPLAAADLDGDRRDDLVIARGDGGLAILLGIGDGTFRPAVTVAGTLHATALTVGDLDGDRHPDVVIGDAAAAHFVVLLGHGDGTFAAPSPITTLSAGAPVALLLADLDGDGHLDLAAATDDTLQVAPGRGDGGFGAPLFQGAVDSPSSLAALDLDGDGRLDLVVAGALLSLLANAGGGSFVPGPSLGLRGPLIRMATGDLDGDGHVDLVGGSTFGVGDARSTVAVYPGRGDGTLNPASEFGCPGELVGLDLADFDGDHGLDVAVAAADAAGLALLANRFR